MVAFYFPNSIDGLLQLSELVKRRLSHHFSIRRLQQNLNAMPPGRSGRSRLVTIAISQENQSKSSFVGTPLDVIYTSLFQRVEAHDREHKNW